MKDPRPFAISSAFAVAALGALSAFGQLNPTVNVLPRPQTAVPGECEQGLAPAGPRVLVSEVPQPAPPKATGAPPALDLKTRMRGLQTAADHGDREAFGSALAAARATIAAYPTGGERDAANDVLRVYDDLERLWDYSFTSPSGAFFDSTTENGALLNMLRRYPDYARAIGDSTVNAGGQMIYPSDESRKFLAGEASKRLGHLGVRPPERISQATPATIAPAPAPLARKVTPHPAPKPAHAPKAAHRPAPKIVRARPVPPKPRPVEPARQPAPATATVPPPPALTTATTATMAASIPAAATTAVPNPPASQQGGGRLNLLFAIILIVVGIGVLIVLLRASD